jgi:AmmeMemoRadiSam system protein A
MSRSVTAYPLDDAHHRALLTIAADSIGHALLRGDDEPEVPEPSGDLALDQAAATFVTLERGEALLGCIGTLEATEPLAASVARNACKAAFADPRLPAVTVPDFEVMAIKVSVLSRLTPMRARSWRDVGRNLRVGTDGLLVESGGHRATLLPSVWPKVDGAAQFLDLLWHKAGLRPRDWLPRTRVSKYTTEEFTDPGPRRLPSLPSGAKFGATEFEVAKFDEEG